MQLAEPTFKRIRPWERLVLAIAGIYNLVWAGVSFISPDYTQFLFSMGAANAGYIAFQSFAVLVALFGLAYLIAASDPVKFWPITAIGLVIMGLFTFIFLGKLILGEVELQEGWMVLFSHTIWLIPFALILKKSVWVFTYEPKSLEDEDLLEDDLHHVKTHKGLSLASLSNHKPIMLVFLRHLGCPFCREALADLADIQDQIQEKGFQIVIVHMSRNNEAEAMVARYGLKNIHLLSDKYRSLYRYFGLRRGFFHEVFGPQLLPRWLKTLQRHGSLSIHSDPFQLPGIFIYFKGRILNKFIHRQAGDRPDYMELIHKLPHQLPEIHEANNSGESVG